MLSRERIGEACRKLLETGEPISGIGFDVGYETLSAFNENFQRRLYVRADADSRVRRI